MLMPIINTECLGDGIIMKGAVNRLADGRCLCLVDRASEKPSVPWSVTFPVLFLRELASSSYQ